MQESRARALDDHGRVLDGRLEHHVGLPDTYASMRDGRKPPDDSVRNGSSETLEEQALLPAEDLAHEGRKAPVVDGVLDAVALRGCPVDIDPEIDQEAL